MKDDCGNFTHYQDQCFLLQSCLITEECLGCISGPTSPLFSSCPWPPLPTTTTTTTTPSQECEEYIVGMQCDLDEYNIIETLHSPTIMECQVEIIIMKGFLKTSLARPSAEIEWIVCGSPSTGMTARSFPRSACCSSTATRWRSVGY